METHLKVIRRLADGALHSGEDLARALGISRAAVWKAVHKAGEALGLEVRSVRGRGYRLAAPLELLDAERILAEIPPHGRRRIERLELHGDIDSTNSHLMRAAQQGAPSGTLCLAEYQRAGRGRRGRTWVSPFGANIYLSLLWHYPFGPTAISGLSLAAGAAVAGVLEAEGVPEIGLKWPNDILWRHRKLAGLLLEVAGEAQGPSLVVVGLGLNTRLQAAQAAGIDQPWVDLDSISESGTIGRNRLAARLAERLTDTLERYGTDGLDPFLPEWARFDRYRGEPVEIRLADQSFTGLHAGVTPEGALCLDRNGKIETFQAGEVSLRPAAKKGSGD
ncbi:MAG: bifunctional biotin--[acetyl-CoA-carboxylase] ligase/biotin operon repressor BirA [Candidatus Thiosymbion ectosymbiont of Robbea hypermnestra]|nr:bifunctional biotin--[acetyl-CoA-carboxylase] ligase/biotin operon repressor BirA [Candidatus Thiosymbion ectosymbiont of Robbea hypermnestra]